MQSSYSYVIARRAKAERPTWQSPGTIFRYYRTFRWIVPGDCHVALLLAMTYSELLSVTKMYAIL